MSETLQFIRKMNLAIHGQDQSVVTALLKDEAVETVKIKDGNVTNAKIENGAINDNKIAIDANINWEKMATDAEIRGTSRLAGSVSIGGTVEAPKATINATSGEIYTAGNLILDGDLLVKGQTVTLNAEQVTVEDKLMQLGFIAGEDAPGATGLTGISVFNGTTGATVNDDQASMVWDAANAVWKFANLSAAGAEGELLNVQAKDLTVADMAAANLDLTTSLDVGAGKFQVDAEGNVAADGTLDVKGDISLLNAFDAPLFYVAATDGSVETAGAISSETGLNVGPLGGTQVFTVDDQGAVVAASFTGIGTQLTELDASNISQGELNDDRLSDNVMLLDEVQTVTGAKTLEGAAATDVLLDAKVAADANARFALQVDGKMLLGSGSAAADVNLYRDAADVLKTDDKLVVGDELRAMGAAQMDSTLNVTGNLTVNTDKFKVDGITGQTEIAGAAKVAGDLEVATDKLKVDVANEMTTLKTALTVATDFNANFGGSVTISGNLTVNGAMTYVNTDNLSVEDRLIQLNRPAGIDDVANTDDFAGLGTEVAGIEIFRGRTSLVVADAALFVWDEEADRFKVKLGSALTDFQAANFYGNGANITGLTAGIVGITAITGMDVSEGVPAAHVQEALESIQSQLDEITGGGSTSLDTLSTQIGNVITGLGFDATSGEMTAFAGTPGSYITGDSVHQALIDLDAALVLDEAALNNHVAADTSGAHKASSISVEPGDSVEAPLVGSDVQDVLEDHAIRIHTLEAKEWRQVILVAAGGETSLNKSGEYAIPSGPATQVFIDGRKVFEGADKQYTVAVGGGSISFAALEADQTIELLYWA